MTSNSQTTTNKLQFTYFLILGIFCLCCIRFLGIPVILERPIIDNQEIELVARSADVQSSTELFKANAVSRYWGLGLVALGLIGVPLFRSVSLQQLLKKNKLILYSSLLWIIFILISTTSRACYPLDLGYLVIPSTFHLIFCWLAFLLGYFLYSQQPSQKSGVTILLVCMAIGLVPVLFSAFQQHYGGLEAMRNRILTEANGMVLPEEFVKKINSQKVYGTMVYHNSLAGLIMLLLPPCLATMWDVFKRAPQILRLLIVGLFGYMGCAAFFWTGSKTAWLIVLLLGAVVILLKAQIQRKYKLIIASSVIVLGMIGFTIQFADYFSKGAVTVWTRVTYWNAAIQNIENNPLLGSGPGTFAIPYQAVKKPEDEMARLCHNDYLEQATDSGIPAAIAYTLFIGACLTSLWRKSRTFSSIDSCILLGLSSFVLQAFMEFSLYIPSIAWMFFLLLGLLLGKTSFNKADDREALSLSQDVR